MKTKHLFILGMVFIAFFALNFIQKIYSKHSAVRQVRHEEWQPRIPEEKVARILFSRPGFPSVELKQDTPATWSLDAFPGAQANLQKIKELLGQLNQLKAELRAEGEDLYARFGITDQESFRVQIFDAAGTALIDFFMGAPRAGQGVFIRLPGKAKIYSIADDLPQALGLFSNLEQSSPRAVFFADLKLIPENFSPIESFEIIQIAEGKRTVLAALERPSQIPGSLWKFISEIWKFSISPDKVEDYLNLLIGAQAENMSVDSGTFKNEFEITLNSGRPNMLRLQFSKKEQGWLVRRENTAAIYEISTFVFDELKRDNARFVADNPLQVQIDEENTVELISNGKTENFSKASGWPSAAAILDAAAKMQLLSFESGSVSEKPSHEFRILRQGKPTVEVRFYVSDLQAPEMKAVISGYDFIFKVSRNFFESIFVPAAPPQEEKFIV